MKRLRTQLAVCGMMVAAMSMSHSLNAQQKAFRISGEGIAPTGLPLPGQGMGPHWIIGNATHLGRHFGSGFVQTDFANYNPGDNTFTGEFGSGAPFVFTGANGDKLVCFYGRTDYGAPTPGTFTLYVVGATPTGAPIVEAEWIADFVPVSDDCTGKFEGVTGSWLMFAFSEPFVLGSTDPVFYWWEGRGRLRFRK